MALFKKNALGSAIFATIAASSASAATGNSDSMMGEMFDNSFFSDSKMTLQLKNYYRTKTRRNDDNGYDEKGDQLPADSSTVKDKGWAQAAHLDFQSGWFMNWVGLDLSAYYSLKLSGSKGKSDVDLFKLTEEGKPQSYGKAGYALKVNLMDHGVLKYGRMTVDTPLLSSTQQYALPSLFQGFYGDFSWEGLKAYTGYFSKVNKVGQSKFQNLSGSNNKDRALTVFGAQYQIENLMLRATQTRQRDFANFTYADATYMMPTNDMGAFTLGVQYGSNSAVGANKDNIKNESSNIETSLNWWGTMLKWQIDNLSAGLSYVRIGSKDGYDGSSNSWDEARMLYNIGNDGAVRSGDRFIGYTAGLVNDFDNPGTSSTRLDLGYDMSDLVKGLSVSAGYIFGNINYSSGTDDRDVSEFDIGVSYQVPFVKGLSAEIQHGQYLAKWKESGDNKKNRKSDTRIMFNYEIAVF